MRSETATLLDPFEVGVLPPSRPVAPTLPDLPDYVEYGATAYDIDVAFVEEINVAPPWTPEPVDRRWRARGWTHES